MLGQLNDDLFIKIIRRVGLSGFRKLGGLIGASKTCSALAFSSAVLKEVNLTEVIMLGHHICLRSLYRPFFNQCLIAGNPQRCSWRGFVWLLPNRGLMLPSICLKHMGSLQCTLSTSLECFRFVVVSMILGTTLKKKRWWEDVPASTHIAGIIRKTLLDMNPRMRGTYRFTLQGSCPSCECAGDDLGGCTSCFMLWNALTLCVIS